MNLGLVYISSFILIMAFKAILIKLLLQDGYQTLEIMMLRNVITFVVVMLILAILYLNNKLTIKSFKTILYLMLVGLLCFHVSSFFDLYSLNFISVNLERLIVHSYPSMVCLLLVFRDGLKAVSKRQWLIIAIIYLLTMAFIGFEKHNIFSIEGVIYALLAAFFYALYFVLVDKKIKEHGGTQITLFSLPLASITINAQFWIVDGQIAVESIQALHVFCFVMLGAVIGIGSMWLFNLAIMKVGATQTAIYSSLGPFVTAILAYVFLGESMSLMQLGILILVILAMTQLTPPKKKIIRKN